MDGILFVLFLMPGIIVVIDFICFIFSRERFLGNGVQKVLEIITMIGLPSLYLRLQDSSTQNDCCTDEAIFSPAHRFSIYTIIIICLIAHFYCSYRKKIAPPIIEVIVNAILVMGIILNVFISIHIQEAGYILFGNLPVVILLIFTLIKNQQLLSVHLKDVDKVKETFFERAFRKILEMDIRLKMPILLIICLPLLFILGSILLLYGQQPDSIIRAFTDTYHHGFSQLDYLCENVDCGGHYLCSVAAKGHKKMVRPVRLGMRGGHLIICNRQLLVSNAFEELLEQKIPFLHKHIRKNYDRIGDLVHRYYWIFNIKWVSDVIYMLMKPAEWFFLLILYTFDTKPEDRIAKQYLSKQDRRLIALSQKTNN